MYFLLFLPFLPSKKQKTRRNFVLNVFSFELVYIYQSKIDYTLCQMILRHIPISIITLLRKKKKKEQDPSKTIVFAMLKNSFFPLCISRSQIIFPKVTKMQVRTQPSISAIKKPYRFCQYNTVPLCHLHAMTNQSIFFSVSRYF